MSIAIVCQCRNCAGRYYEHASRADYTGYCSQKCWHEKAKACGYRKSKDKALPHSSEYDVLKRYGHIGSVVIEVLLTFPRVRLPKL